MWELNPCQGKGLDVGSHPDSLLAVESNTITGEVQFWAWFVVIGHPCEPRIVQTVKTQEGSQIYIVSGILGANDDVQFGVVHSNNTCAANNHHLSDQRKSADLWCHLLRGVDMSYSVSFGCTHFPWGSLKPGRLSSDIQVTAPPAMKAFLYLRKDLIN